MEIAMQLALDDVWQQAKNLPVQDKNKLIEQLTLSVFDEAKGLSESWVSEIKSRVKALENGDLNLVDAEKVFAGL